MLYHISENSNIEQFIPRKSDTRPDLPPIVWALSEKRLVNYLFPRECPRIIFTKGPEVSEEDQRVFFGHTTSQTIITVESSWYERIREITLFKYSFEQSHFQLIDEIAGYYISEEIIKPVNVEPVNNLIDQILSYGVELRFTPNLHPLRNALLESSINDFSIIRFRNAEK